MSTAVKAIHFAFFAPLLLDTVKHDCTIVIAAPTQNQATIMFDRIRSLIINNDFQNIYSQLNIQEIDQMVDILNKINWEFEISYNE